MLCRAAGFIIIHNKESAMPDVSQITLQQLQFVCEGVVGLYGEKALEAFLKDFWTYFALNSHGTAHSS